MIGLPGVLSDGNRRDTSTTFSGTDFRLIRLSQVGARDRTPALRLLGE
jgi:hypothetical protein